MKHILKIILRHCRHAGDIISTLMQVYAPSTVLTYAHTMASLWPQLKESREWQDAMKCAYKAAAVAEVNHAVAATPEQIQTLLQSNIVPTKVQDTVLLQWISASRHADLEHMYLAQVWRYPIAPHENTVAVRWNLPVWKSDLLGKRHCSKTITMPEAVLRRIMQGGFAGYREVYRHMTKMALTVHSIRRGAVTALSNKGEAPESIVTLTQHAMPGEAIALRVYMEPSPESKEARKQMCLSFELLKMVM